jgi:hypothetical protein
MDDQVSLARCHAAHPASYRASKSGSSSRERMRARNSAAYRIRWSQARGNAQEVRRGDGALTDDGLLGDRPVRQDRGLR